MVFTYNRSPFRWLALLVYVLPLFEVTTLHSALMIAPAVVLSVMVLWIVPTQLMVVAPEHLQDAVDDVETIYGDDVHVILFHQSEKAYAEYLKNEREK